MQLSCIRKLIIVFFYIIANSKSENFDRICDPIFVDDNHNSFVPWRNVTTQVRCTQIFGGSALWFNNERILKMSVGCESPSDYSLTLPWFPTLENIRFYAFNETHRSICEFTVKKGIIQLLSKQVNDFDKESPPEHSMSVYSKNYYQGHYYNITASFCKQGYRNFYMQFEKKHVKLEYRKNENDPDRLEVFSTITVEPTVGNELSFFVFRSNRELKFIQRFEPDVDECFISKQNGLRLCQDQCIDMSRSYRCSEDKYIKFACGNDQNKNWICPTGERYLPQTFLFQSNQCNSNSVDECWLASSINVDLCTDRDNGRIKATCVDYPVGFTCINGTINLDKCNELRRKRELGIDWTCPDFFDAYNSDLLDKSLITIIENINTIIAQQPSRMRDFLDIKQDEFITQFQALDEDSRNKIIDLFMNSTNDLISIETPLNPLQISNHIYLQEDEKRLNIQAMVDKLLDIFQLSDSLTKEQNGFRINKFNLQDMKNIGQTNLTFTKPVKDGESQVIVAQFSPDQADYIWQIFSSQESLPMNFTSDVFIVKGEPDTFINVNYKADPEQQNVNNAICQKYEFNEISLPDSKRCSVFVVSESEIQCNCKISSHRPMVIGIIFLVNKDLQGTSNVGILSIINYVCITITIIALSIFILLLFYIEEFRLDQFNIAICLLIFAVTILFAPHVSLLDQFLRGCYYVGILLNYFILAAFIWKLIFGLNSFLLVMCYTKGFDMVSNKKWYLPLCILGYGLPIVIIYLWYKYFDDQVIGQQKTDNNQTIKYFDSTLCIGPRENRWPLIGTIFTVIIFNIFVLLSVVMVVSKNYWMTRKIRLNKTTNFVVLTQLLFTLGIPFSLILIQFFDGEMMLILKPISLAITSVSILCLVAFSSEKNRSALLSVLSCRCRRKKKSNSRLIRSSSLYNQNLKFNNNYPIDLTNNHHYDKQHQYIHSNSTEQTLIQPRKSSINTEIFGIASNFDSDYQSNSFGGRDSSNSHQIILDDNLTYVPSNSGSYTPFAIAPKGQMNKIYHHPVANGSICNSQMSLQTSCNQTNSLINMSHNGRPQTATTHFYPQTMDNRSTLSSPMQGIMCSTLI